LASASITSPNAVFSLMRKVRSSTTSYPSIARDICSPIGFFLAQRVSDATQSLAVTGAPSCHFSPSRSLNVYVIESGLTSKLSTICGFGSNFESSANKVS